MRRVAAVATVFSPAAPIDQYKLFAGRTQQVRDVLSSVAQRGTHVILFGERGVGKTSLANVLAELLSGEDVQSLNSGTVNCDGTDDFPGIWRKAFRELTIFSEEPGEAGFNSAPKIREESMRDLLPPGELTPDDIRYHLDQVPQPVMIILDEIDRIPDRDTTRLLADTIKTLSDHSVDATLVLVGVADSVDQLVEQHQSVERALRQVRLPRMSEEELYEILDKGLSELVMTIEPRARDRIARLSEGLPTYTHLLALEAAQRAIIDDRNEVSMSDVDAAIRTAVENSQQSIRSTYHSAVSSPQKENLYSRVLLACALAPADFMGFFSAADVRGPMSEIMGKPYEIPAFSRHLNDFAEDRGPVLQKIGTARRFRFRFLNPMMQPFVIMHGLANQVISETQLRRLQDMDKANADDAKHGVQPEA